MKAGNASAHAFAQERAKNFGASILAPIYECLPDLLKPREGAKASKAANGSAKADGKGKAADGKGKAADGKGKAADGKGKAADGNAKPGKKQKR